MRQRFSAWLLALLALCRCDLYEGRSLDLFAPEPAGLVECRDESACSRERPYCTGGNCVQCLVDANCDRGHPACVDNACVECRSADNCGPRRACNTALGVCAPSCNGTSDCTGPATPLCSNVLAVCLQCIQDEDCRDRAKPVCGRGGQCVACAADASCPIDAGPRAPKPPPPPDAAGAMSMPLSPLPMPAPPGP
jgi:hypothetical protein